MVLLHYFANTGWRITGLPVAMKFENGNVKK
jgi:hypothetical protein